MKEIRLGYSLTNNPYAVLGILPFSMFLSTGLIFTWHCFADNRILQFLPLGIFLFLLLIRFGLLKWHYLIINDKGITLNYLLKRSKFVSWDSIGRFKYNDLKESRKGWTILYKKDADRIGNLKKEDCALFIPQNHVAASGVAVNEALIRGFQEHVWHGSSYQNNFNLAQIDGNPKGVYALCLIWIAFSLLYFYIDSMYTPSDLETIMGCTLVGGERFDTSLGEGFCVAWMLCFSYYAFPHLFLPVHWFTMSLSLWLGRFLIVITIIVASFNFSEKRNVYLNCSEPITNPIETIDAKITKLAPARHRRGWHIKFSFTYEGKSNVFIFRRQNDFIKALKDAYAIVKLQKGARGLPIVQEIAIPEIGWAFNPHEENTTK